MPCSITGFHRNLIWDLVGSDDTYIGRVRSELRSVTPEDSHLADYWLSRPVEVDSGSPTSMHRRGYWLTQYVNNHALCNSRLESKAELESEEGPSDQILPTRMLDVGGPGADLRLAKTRGKGGRWLALSHCWGQQQLIHTLAATVTRQTQSIPFTDLLPTFKDAVTITRSLGIPYLWIDSLCIIQNSKQDWLDNSAIMHTVFQNATLAIVTKAAEDSSQGIFDSTRSTRKRYQHRMKVAATANNG